MKKIKTIFTFGLVLAMTLGLTMTAFAQSDTTEPAVPTTTITVSDTEAATLYIRQVVKMDRTTETGWAFVDADSRALFADFDGDTDQAKIRSYKAIADESESNAIAKFGNKLDSWSFSEDEKFTSGDGGFAPGLYVIKAVEEGYTYNIMIANINFKDKPSEGLKPASLVAKKTPTTVSKTLNTQESADDTYVEYGEEITYDVKAKVPYSPKGSTTEFKITDELTGGEFKTVEGGDNNGKVEVKVSIGDEAVIYIAPEADGTKLTIDLAYLLEDNEFANADVIVTYTAIATGKLVNNKAKINNNDDTSVVKSYSAKLKITKTDIPEQGKDPAPLSGAKFVIANGQGENAKYAILDNGKLSGWGTLEEAEATAIVTGSDGIATAEGFDSEKDYWFHEVEAPEGYSINDTDVKISWVDDPDEEDDNFKLGKATMSDTTLITLPYTGGSGTAAFTGFGVLLMSVAAGLYFANKKNKASK
ncbi:LPXTG-motif cell wall anchor domain-containing protein [Pseudobutyrivibrio sp. YE44]|uniref:SpaA isopeptide-forming pilin-related protein n=1 Tax=Pseudobutyrivibrio sp. YE44 TaxID=1520802 RepID=UPI00088971B9|nr:SpaA isopeptide-forming pilin-related protein [Pseudobutyrivibrio sp. YE44]SDB34731.1 LPXTG-motif cell wall anchor domain-containing protein [Pseudobutyrivibrio sp. YE44]